MINSNIINNINNRTLKDRISYIYNNYINIKKIEIKNSDIDFSRDRRIYTLKINHIHIYDGCSITDYDIYGYPDKLELYNDLKLITLIKFIKYLKINEDYSYEYNDYSK